METTRPWLKQFPSNVPAEINTGSHVTVIDMVNDALEKYKHSVAYTFMGKDLTFSELDKKSSHFAGYLQSIGLKAGDRIVLMMPNILQFPIALDGRTAGRTCGGEYQSDVHAARNEAPILRFGSGGDSDSREFCRQSSTNYRRNEHQTCGGHRDWRYAGG